MILKSPQELLPHLFRQEYAKMTAVLCRHFGLQHIELAEDIASDTFLKASEHWPVHGIPKHPVAWLYTVAKNKLKDYYKHLSVFEQKVKPALLNSEQKAIPEQEWDHRYIEDSFLAMIFAVCNPVNTPESQICLALQILCGFSMEEIARAFLSKPETIKKRLQRARQYLRNDGFNIVALDRTAIQKRLNTVLKTLYLLYNEGYYSVTHDTQIRAELCSEAMRLTLLLTENRLTNTPAANALLALMCYQSSRLPARMNEHNETILFEEQDVRLWDQSLIHRGHYYLIQATEGAEVSKYHLEAGIAYWHTTTDASKWNRILQLYNQLVLLEYSPITVLNRLFAYSKVYGKKMAIEETERLESSENNYYYALLGYLYTDIDNEKAIYHYERAIQLSRSVVEKRTLQRQLVKLRDGNS